MRGALSSLCSVSESWRVSGQHSLQYQGQSHRTLLHTKPAHASSAYLEHRQLLPLLLYRKGSVRIVNNGCCRIFG